MNEILLFSFIKVKWLLKTDTKHLEQLHSEGESAVGYSLFINRTIASYRFCKKPKVKGIKMQKITFNLHPPLDLEGKM